MATFYCNRINTPRKQGGLGPVKIPLLSDLTHQISKDYGVYLEDQGHALRYNINCSGFFNTYIAAVIREIWNASTFLIKCLLYLMSNTVVQPLNIRLIIIKIVSIIQNLCIQIMMKLKTVQSI